jgi:cell division protein ZapA (FtsZ GTPase activity inhibitor)
MEVVEIEILGRRYTLQSDRPAGHIKQVALFVDGRLRELAGGSASAVQRDHAILAALNIASELFLLRDRTTRFRGALSETLDHLVTRIDSAVSASTGSSVDPEGAPKPV